MNQHSLVGRSFKNELVLAFQQRGLAYHLYQAFLADHKKNMGLGLLIPFFSVFFYVSLLGFTMSLVFHEPINTFIPFFAISFSIWQQIANMLSEGAHANDKTFRFLSFPLVSGFIVHLSMAYDFFVALLMKLFASILIIAWVNLTLLVHINYIAVLLGLILLTLTLLSWSIPIAFFFDKYRIMRCFLPQMLFIVYLITPIFWDSSRIVTHYWVIQLNPVFYLIELIRVPILYGHWPLVSYEVSVIMIIFGLAASYFLFPINRNLVMFRWLA